MSNGQVTDEQDAPQDSQVSAQVLAAIERHFRSGTSEEGNFDAFRRAWDELSDTPQQYDASQSFSVASGCDADSGAELLDELASDVARIYSSAASCVELRSKLKDNYQPAIPVDLLAV